MYSNQALRHSFATDHAHDAWREPVNRHPHADQVASLAEGFESIGLAELNATADMLQRRDNKYVVHDSILRQAMAELATRFNVLEIDGRRAFTYETRYFDDDDLTIYFDQHRGRRKRCKVRTRRYVDSNLCFIEVKLKATRGMTDKKRMAYPAENFERLDDNALAFVNASYRDMYGSDFGLDLHPVLDMRYLRLTLVAKEGGERMTIDHAPTFVTPDRKHTVRNDLFIVETKSGNANGIADKVLRKLHQHPTPSCSKYCVAMAAVRQVEKYNKFLPALRHLDAMPPRMVLA